MISQVDVLRDRVQNLSESLKELPILTVIERLQVLLQVGNVPDHTQDVAGVDDFGFDRFAVLGHQRHHHGVKDELSVVHEFHAGERGNGRDQQVRRLLEIQDNQAVDALVDLEFVLFVPG